MVGHSHSNDPMPCHAAIASIDIILEEMLTDVAQRIGAYWREHLERLASRHEIIGDIRGRGLLQGIELVTDRATREPAYAQGREIGRRCLENGLILSVRRNGSVFRFVPPFTTTEAQMGRGGGDSGWGYCFDIKALTAGTNSLGIAIIVSSSELSAALSSSAAVP